MPPRWFWCAVFSQAYEKAANTQAAKDMRQLLGWLEGGAAPDSVEEFSFDAAVLREATPRLGAVAVGVFLLFLTALVTFRAATMAVGAVAILRSDAQEWTALLAIDTLRPPTWQQLDSVLLRSSPPPEESSADTRRLSLVEGSPVLEVSLAHDQGWQYLPGRFPDSLRTLLVSDTVHPELEQWRALGRTSGHLPPLWYHSDLESFDSPFALPIALFARTKGMAYRNVSAAVLAMERGDPATALKRARENVAVGRQLLTGRLIDQMLGTVIIGIGRETIANIGRVTNDDALREEAARLREVATRLRLDYVNPMRGLWVYAANPEAPSILRLVGDSTLPPPVRWELLNVSVAAYCLNTREILFGPTATRVDLMNRTAAAGSDLPRLDEWAAVNTRWINGLIETPRDWTDRELGDRSIPLPSLKLLGILGVDGLRARLEHCFFTTIFP